MTMRASILVLPALWIALAAVLGGCGGATAAPIVVTPMTPADELAFDNGADFIDDPTLLEGSWLDEWEHDITERCERADVIVVVTIQQVQTSTDLDRRESFRLVGHVDLERFGETDDDVSLIVRTGQAGYQSIRGAESRLLNQQFVAFIRWVDGESGGVTARWHLSPATERVSRRVNSLLERRRPSEDRRRVIVHDRRNEDTESDDE